MERIKQAVEKAREKRDAIQVRKTGLDFEPHTLRHDAISLDRFHTEEPSQRALRKVEYTKTKTIAVNDKLFKRNRIISNTLDNSPEANAYKMLRTRVLQQMKRNQWTTLGVTSPGSGEGKTLTAINLAISLAAEGNNTVLLVDFDLRCPGVSKIFDYDPEYDISHYLYDDIPLHKILFNPGIPRLVVLPASRPIPNSSEALSSAEVIQLIQEIKTRYKSRLIIFDLPPMLATDDVLAFSPMLDTALLVVEDGKTRREELLRSMEMLTAIELAGVVLNKSSEKLESY